MEDTITPEVKMDKIPTTGEIDFSLMSDNDILEFHRKLHAIWDAIKSENFDAQGWNADLLRETHNKVLNEMKIRGLSHTVPINDLDKVIAVAPVPVQQIKPFKDIENNKTNEFFSLAELENLPWDRALILEKKVDGIRCELIKDGSEIQLYTYWGNEISVSDNLRSCARKYIKPKKCVLDGELYHPNGDCNLVHHIVKEEPSALKYLKIKFFDVLQVENESLLNRNLRERKEFLEAAVEDNEVFSKIISFTRPLDFKTWNVPQEGLVIKDLESTYSEEGSKSWWKYVNPSYFTRLLADARRLAQLDDNLLIKNLNIIHRLERKLFEGKFIDGWDEDAITWYHVDLQEELEKRNLQGTKQSILDEPMPDLKMLFKYKFLKSPPTDMSDGTLLGVHARAKQIWESVVRRQKMHPYRIGSVIDGMWWIKQEMMKRGFRIHWSAPIDFWALKFKGHLVDSLRKKGVEDTTGVKDSVLKKIQLDYEHEELIKDIKSYKAEEQPNEVLADDWRIVCAWYSSIKEGQQFQYSEKEVVNLAREIVREIERRVESGKMEHEFRPEEMQPHAQELYKLVQGAVSKNTKLFLTQEYLPIFKGTTSDRGTIIVLNDVLDQIKNSTLVSDFILLKVPSGKLTINNSPGDLVTSITEWRINRAYPDIKSIKPSDFQKRWSPFKLRRPFVQLVGSLANWSKTDGDIDIIIHAKENEPVFRQTVEHLSNLLVKWKDRLHIMSDQEWCGPFTNFVNLFDLTVNIKWQTKAEGISIGDLILESKKKFYRFEMSRDPRFEGKASTSRSQDKVELFRPFFQLKPTHGRTKTEQYSVDGLITVVDRMWKDWKEVGIVVEKKYDGGTCQIHKQGDKVKIWMEDGSEVTNNLPTLVREVAEKHKDDWVVIGELELYLNGEHQPRAESAGVYNHKSDKEKDIRVTVYDKLWYNGNDIHKLSAIERLKHILEFHPSEHFKIADYTIAKNEDSLRRAIKKYSEEEGSEGAMLKLADAPYDLDKKSNKQIKFKKELFLIAKVKAAHQVKGSSGTFYYDMEIDGAPYVGRTYNTSIKAEKGDKLKVVFVDISEYHDDSKVWFNWWAPRVVEKSNEPLSDAKTAHDFVLKTTGRVEEKKLPKFEEPKPEGVGTLASASPSLRSGSVLEWLEIKRKEYKGTTILEYNNYTLMVNCADEEILKVRPNAILISDSTLAGGLTRGNDQPVYSTPEILDKLKSFPMENINAVKAGDEFDLGPFHIKVDGKPEDPMFIIHAGQEEMVLEQLAKKYRWVFQNHFRGTGVHGDMRFEMPDGMLLGFTLANQIEGTVAEPVESLEKAREYRNKDEVWKMNLHDGSVKEREGKTHIRVNTKARQPKVWLNIEGVTPTRTQEPGTPGGTKKFHGVFDIVDSGSYEMGAQKPDFNEFFLLGNKWKGRVIFRFLPGMKGERRLAGWMYWKPEDQTPYILGRKAVKEDVLPPKGESWLPTEWEKKIPAEFRFWEAKSSESALELRRELRKFLLKNNQLSYLSEDSLNQLGQPEDENMFMESSNFKLTVLTWKGQTVVRDLPVNQYFLKLGSHPFFLFEKNPLVDSDMNAVEDSQYSDYFKEGTYQPSSKINPNKSIPAKIETLDSGAADITENKLDVIQVLFKGNELKGKWLFTKDDPKQNLWELRKSGSVFERREYSMENHLTELQIDKIRILTLLEKSRPTIASILKVSKNSIWKHQCELVRRGLI